MMNRPDFTDEQKEYLISIVDHWYLYWKTRMVEGPHPRMHNLGRAKEQLKNIIWEGHSVRSDLLWTMIDAAFEEKTENDGKTTSPSST